MRRSVMLLVCMLFMVVLAAIPAYATTYSVRLNPSSPGIGESITCILNVDGYDVTNSQDKIWFYYQWVKNGNPQNSYSGYGTDALPSGVTSNGDYWQCKILFDGTVQGQSPNTLIGEAPYEPPSGPKTARIEPSTPYQGDGLTCILKINGYDINDPQDKIWFYYQWLKNGAVQSSYSGYGSDLIPSGITNTGQTWVCKILFDGAVQAQSSSVTIQPPQHNPTISLSISPANPGLSQDITCTASVSDTDGNLQNVVFRWYKNSVYITGSEKTKTVNGASASSSDTLSSSNTGYGDVIKCEATVHDTTGRTATANKQVTVESAPENTPPTLSGIPDKSVQVGQTISQIDLYNYAGDAQDPDEQLTYTIDYESNTGVIDCYITGGHYVACGNGLSAGYSDITVRVTDTGGLYETDTFRITVTSAPVEHDPEIYSMTLTPLNPGTNNDLTCTVGVYDGDSNLQKVVFRWYKNGAHITGSEETKTVSGSDATVYDTLPSSNTYYSDVIKCEATVHDFTGRTDTDYMQVTVEPSNQPPVADAGPDQTKTDTDNNGYESFTLDGTGSYDTDGTIASYVWKEGAATLGSGSTLSKNFNVGTHTVTLTVTDDDGATASDTVIITANPYSPVNVPPTADAGPDQTKTDTDNNGYESFTLDGTGSYDTDGTIASYVWKEGAATLGSGSTLSKNFNVGTHTVTLTVTDDDGASDDDTVVITVNPYVPGAHDPSIDSMSLTPSNPTKFQDITCSASVSDADGNLNSIEFKWFVDGSNVRTQLKGVSGSFATSSDVLPSSFTDYNDIVRCEAKVSDSTSRTDTEIRSVTIRPETPVNTPPTISGIPDQPVQVGQTISQIDLYNYASDAQNSDNEMTYTIQSESNTGVIDCYITGGHYVACGNGLQAGYSDVTVRVTDTGSLYDTDTFRITVTSVPTGYEPVIESFVITPANPDTNNDIDCTVLASDDDGDLDRAVFRWYRNGQQVGSAVTKTLSGYLDSEYVILSSSSTNPGDVIRCDVTVYDDNSNTDTDSRSVTVQSAPADNPPYIDSLLIIPQNPTSQNDLTCRVSASDPNGDLDRVDFLWYRNGQQIGSTVTKSMTGYNDYETDVISSSQTADGDIIQCRTVVYDDNSNSVLWSTSVIIGSNPPENNAPTVYADLLPQNPLSSQSLTCSGIADDYDGDLDRMVFEWTIPNRLGSTVIRSNTVPIAGAIDIGDDVLSSSYTQEGDLVTCRIVAYDDENLYGSDSASVYVQTSQPGNQPPVALFYAYPTSIYEGDQVMFDADSSYDIDGSVVSYYFDFGDGSNSGWTSIDHVYHTYNIQGTYTTRVRVRDDDSSDSAWSSTAAIVVIRETNPPTGDHDPVIDNIYIRPPAPEENDDLECHVSVYDSDGDIDRILIRWYVDGGLKRTRNIYDSGSRATVYDTFDEHYTTYDDDVRCVATVYDHNGNTDEESYTVMIDDYYKPSCYPSCNICPTCTTGNCGVSIKSFDFSRNTNANKLSWAEVGVLNSGSRNANLELKVTVDGSVKGVYTVYMASGSEISRHFDFGLEEGRHDLKIDAKMDCGSTDSETGVIYVGETTPGFVPGEEYVDIYPRDMQMDAFSTGQIYIEMNSPSEQTFTINVGGMDESWLHYDNDVEVRGKRTEKIVLTPKGSGTYNLNIVVSSESGKTFRKDVKVYVNDYEEDAARRFLPLASGAAGAATLTGNYIVTGLSLWGAGNIIMSFIALLLLILIIYLLYRRHKTDDSYNEQPRYSPEMAEAVDQDREFFSNYPYYRQNGMESQRY